MRTLLKFTLDVTAGNKAIAEGSLPQVLQEIMERIKPEAAYFLSLDGTRTGFMVFDLKDSADIPLIAEPLFMALNAKVDFTPVMNLEDLQKALQNLEAAQAVAAS